MLDKLGYYELVMSAFQALKRDIKDAEQYTTQEYNTLLEQVKAENEKAIKEQEQEKVTTTKESKPKEAK